MRMKVRKLTKKQKLFIAFLPQVNWVGSEAVIRAGYRCKNRQIAAEVACELLKKTEVLETVNILKEEYRQKEGIQSENVLTRMARIGYADIRKIFGPNNTILDVKDWPDDIVPAVAGIEVFEEYQGKGEDRILIGHTKKVRLWDPNPSLTNMAKNVGAIGNGKHRDEDDEKGEIGRVLTTLELSAKIVYLVKLAVERKKKIEGEKVEEERERKRANGSHREG
jgi:phage terminase small subunit